MTTAAPASAARDREIVLNATPGDVSVAAVRAAGGDRLAPAILLDVSNPLDFSTGRPRVFTDPEASIAEQLQREFPTYGSSNRCAP